MLRKAQEHHVKEDQSEFQKVSQESATSKFRNPWAGGLRHCSRFAHPRSHETAGIPFLGFWGFETHRLHLVIIL